MATAAFIVGIIASGIGIFNAVSNGAMSIAWLNSVGTNLLGFIKDVPNQTAAFIQISGYLLPAYIVMPLIAILGMAVATAIIRLYGHIFNGIS